MSLIRWWPSLNKNSRTVWTTANTALYDTSSCVVSVRMFVQRNVNGHQLRTVSFKKVKREIVGDMKEKCFT